MDQLVFLYNGIGYTNDISENPHKKYNLGHITWSYLNIGYNITI